MRDLNIFLIAVLSLLIVQLFTIYFPLGLVSGRQTGQESFSSTIKTYWVEVGARGDGRSEDFPAGNITYILDTYVLTDSTVKVKPGIYNAQIETFPLTLDDRGVTIEATGNPSDTIIYGPGWIEEDYPLIELAADETTIRGFTIGNWGVAVSVTSSMNTIQGNHITNNKWGIRLKDTLHSTCSSNMIRDNTVTNNTDVGINIEGSNNMITKNNITANGIGVNAGGWNNTVKGNTITNNGDGITVVGMNNMIIGNIIENAWYGVHITAGSSDNLIEDNTINSNHIGVCIDHSTDNLVKENNVSNNRGYGILLEDTSYNTIEGNIISNNGKNGIKLSLNVDNTTIRNNVIRHNGVGGDIFILFRGLPTLNLATVSVGIAFLTAFVAFHFFKSKRES